MEQIALLGLLYIAVGAALFAQPEPGMAEPHDFTPWGQAEIFYRTLPTVLAWPLILLRRRGT